MTNGFFFSFRFTSEEDSLGNIKEGPWSICGKVLHLMPWKANFQPIMENMNTAPVWIPFPGLPFVNCCHTLQQPHTNKA